MLLQYSSKILQPTQRLAAPARSPGICCRVSRRELAIFTNSTALLLSASQALLHVRGSGISKAEQQQQQQQLVEEVVGPNSNNTADHDEAPATDQKEAASSCIDSSSSPATKRAFLDISIEGQPVGRIVVGVYEGGPAPLGASRFLDLVSGRAGVSYRRKEFVKIMPGYVQHAGVRSYGVDAELLQAATPLHDALEREWARSYTGSCPRPLNSQGSLSILVRNPSKPPPKTKLVARGGKLQMDQEEVGADPNATEFLICTEDSPQLDDSALVIGRVLQGMDVVRRIAQVKTVQDNTTSPYFRVAKLIGDKRAVVAERGFNRPYSKVLVTNCGLLD